MDLYRRQFIKRGGLWVAGAVALPQVVRASAAMPWLKHSRGPSGGSGGGGGSPSFIYSVGQTVSPTGSDSNIPKVDFALLGKITIPSAGTATKLGFWVRFVNASTPVKLALFDASRVVVGSAVSGTIASGDGQWHDFTSSVTVPSSGTYYVGISTNGPYDGSIVGVVAGGASGDGYLTYDSAMYTAFPSLTGLTAVDGNWAFRIELTP